VYSFSSAVALYLFTSNLFSIAQELYIKRKYHKSIVVV
jgi:membrane protein insertase Oxa1/YidC/SpoIIIJ